MADISTAVSMARVPILGEDGRISDDYIPAAIGENVTKAESAATRAESAATAAEGSASTASQSATQAAQSAQQVADKYITGAAATTLGAGEQATAQVVDQVLRLGIPQGIKGDKGDPGEAATVTVGTTTTGEAGTEATVTNSGTTSAAVLDFTIPRGAKGDKGDTGTGVPDGGTPGQLLSKTDSGTAWVDPPSTGNVLVGTATGYVAHGEDAYAQKPREVRIKGKTWVNRWPAISQSIDGITIATDGTGLITVTGTATKSAYVSVPINGLAGSKQYTMCVSSDVRTSVSVMVQTEVGGSYSELVSNTAGTTDTGTSPASFDSAVAAISVQNGTTVNTSFRVMLVDGTEAPDCFTPPTSITSVQPGNLVTAGKNLITPGMDAKSGTVTGTTFFTVSDVLPAGTYTLSGTFSDNIKYRLLDLDCGSRVQSSIVGIEFNGRQKLDLYVDTAGDYSWANIQLELGSTATAYEPPSITTTPLPEVELRGLPSGTCDELVIKADGTCEVERRTKLVDGEVVALDTPTTEPQSPVTLPQLPAPTFNQYHDADVPSDTSVTYERDVNIAFDQLAKQVAGTASAVAVREASTIEEE